MTYGFIMSNKKGNAKVCGSCNHAQGWECIKCKRVINPALISCPYCAVSHPEGFLKGLEKR